MVVLDAFAKLLGSAPNQPLMQTFLAQFADVNPGLDSLEPEIKAYPDVVYHNYRILGLSLQYEASASVKDASKSDLNGLRLAAIDIYSGQDDKRWTLFPGLPLQIDAVSIQASIAHDSTGKDLVSSLGEPQRKGGGAGGRSGPAAWMEWTLQLCSTNSSQPKDIKIQIELAGAAARGADRWNAERAGSCPWAVITIT